MPQRKPQQKNPAVALEKYHLKRDFKNTPEPDSGHAAGSGRSYVIQEHHARSHHFDFRLEIDGVLVSWAVPKGIPEDTSAKRLAVHVEDHPLDYGLFEGEIPEGNYGAGKVAIWDRGEWEPLKVNWRGEFEKGKLNFMLRGERLAGHFLLARMKEEPNWLLRKLKDLPADAQGETVKEVARFIHPQLARVVSSVPAGKQW
ncbi:MAG: hypothetical protein H7Y36_10465, partial [Armatimonadetes bacterium]|nr:hypothetical protein [Akkermansiaceae bacterium]